MSKLSFFLAASLISATPLLLFAKWRNVVARWPWPGLWWMALTTLAIVLVLICAGCLL